MSDAAKQVDFDTNPYEVLGLGAGSPTLSAEDIKKAYRKRALALHPDKRPQAQRSAAEREFNELQKAYDLLCDAAARAAWDGYAAVRAARAERDRGLDERRKKMKHDLEAREQDFASRRSEEDVAKARLKQEIERLRKAAADKAARASAPAVPAQPVSAEAMAQLSRTLKVAWDRHSGDYSATELREVLGVFGQVEDVLIRDGKPGKGSALVVMATQGGAQAAASSACGHVSRPLLVVPAAGRGAAEAQPPAPAPAPPSASLFGNAPAAAPAAAPPTGKSAFPSFSFGGVGGVPSGGAGAGGSVHAVGAMGRDYEHVTLHRMRAAAERARAVAEAEAEVAKGTGDA